MVREWRTVEGMLSTQLLSYYRHISQQPFTVVDVETTGTRPPQSRVIEVSVLQASLAAGVLHQETHLINPSAIVPPSITRFTGISQEMVDRAASSSDVWHGCLPLLNTGTLTAHNLSFDYGFIQAEYRRLNIAYLRPDAEQLCTVILARLMLPDLPSRSLPNLVQHFGFAIAESHRAEADTLACWLLAKRLLTEIQTEADATLLARFHRQWLPLKAAAEVMKMPSKRVRKILDEAGVEPRIVGTYNTPMYQRGAIERVYEQLQSGEQRSLFSPDNFS
jgi:DNA polymerase III subunit epsilon